VADLWAPVYVAETRLIVCDYCATGSFESGAQTDDEARREAMREGWHVNHYGSWFCPPCTELVEEATDRDWWIPEVIARG
jgi:hypothetical protein